MKFLKTNYRYFLCFFIPAIILLIIFKESKIYPFGDYSYLYSDLFQQYMPFLVNLEHKLANSQSLAYSWNLGLGLPFSPILSYYLTSPANLIIMLIDSSLIADAIDIMIIIKISLCAVTFCYYLSKNMKIGIYLQFLFLFVMPFRHMYVHTVSILYGLMHLFYFH